MLVADLGTWPNIVETGGEELELGMIEDWNMGNGEKREIMNNRII